MQLSGIPGKDIITSGHLFRILRKPWSCFVNCNSTTSSGEMASPVPENEKIAGSVVVRVKGDISEIDWTSISRSVFVTGFRAHTTPEELIIHFQRRKNGGGDIEKIILSKKGTAVITFDSPEGERNNELLLYIELNSVLTRTASTSLFDYVYTCRCKFTSLLHI